MALLTKMLGIENLDMEKIGADMTQFLSGGMEMLARIDARLARIEQALGIVETPLLIKEMPNGNGN